MQAIEDSAKRPEQKLQSFASLLSSAVTTSGTVPLTGCPSAISCFLSHVDSNTTCVSIPSLSLKNRSAVKTATAFVRSKQNLEESAAFSLSVPLLYTKEDVVAAPTLVLQNVLESFDSLIDSRLKSSLTALVRQTLHKQKMSMIKKTDENLDLAARQAKIILNLFSSSIKAISINTVVTSFRVLPMDDDQDSLNGCSDLILPLVFESIIDVKILGQLITVALRAPGTITGSFRSSDPSGNVGTKEEGTFGGSRSCLNGVQIAFDTLTLLKAMMKQARHVVKKAMLAASGVANLLASDSGKQFLIDPSVSMKEKVSLTKQPSQDADAPNKSEESSSASRKTLNMTNTPPKDPSASSKSREDYSSSSHRFILSRTDNEESPSGATLTRRASCPLMPLMPPPPPRPPSCGSSTSSSSSTGLCSLSEAATLVSDKANASFGDLQSQTSSSSSYENVNSSRHRTPPIVSVENLARQSKLGHKSGKKRSKPEAPQRYSTSAWEEDHDGNGKANQEWRTGTPTVSSDDLRILPCKKRRRASC